MTVIEIRAVPYDLFELLKRVAPLRPPRLVRRQVARVQMRYAARPARKRTEILASRQVVRRVHRYLSAERRRKQIWISVTCIYNCGIEGVTPVAIPHCVDDITAQSDQRAILSLETQGHGSNCKTLFNLGFIIAALIPLVVVILCANLRGSDKQMSTGTTLYRETLRSLHDMNEVGGTVSCCSFAYSGSGCRGPRP